MKFFIEQIQSKYIYRKKIISEPPQTEMRDD